MNLATKLLRESSYNRQVVSRNRIDFGGFYHISYTSPNGPDTYFIFVIHPNLDDKTHCLDLERIQDEVFDKFFKKIRMDNEFEIIKQKNSFKGYVIDDIKKKSFYDNYIKNNKRLTEEHPYKTLKFDKIQNVRYIAYDIIN